ncbi:MAG: hypothetical protein F4Z72_14965 [Gemmatimonadales bacterium]|nr:hypothetical protein [Candidatus Palauibacter irciniicola]MYC17020.1 hypothetical protein [Gemmatimonadales bacterium]
MVDGVNQMIRSVCSAPPVWTRGLIAALLVGCGGSADTMQPDAAPPRPASIEVSPATVALSALGDTVRLHAEVRDQDGRRMESIAVSWTSNDLTVATVNETGLVAAEGNGAATVTATTGSASGSVTVSVVQVADTVMVTPPTTTLVAGGSVRLLAEARDANGQVVAGAEFMWSSNDTAVAIVDDSGLVLGLAEGTTTVRAFSGRAFGSAEVSVATNPDRAALVALYEATGGDSWARRGNWLSAAPLAAWEGVRVDGTGRVRLLALPENHLRGPLPAELGNLITLEVLILNHNELTGPIPPELENLTRLDSLGLWGSALTGQIPPGLGGLKELRHLSLGFNELTGGIPPELGNLGNLEILHLSANKLTGAIPRELGNLVNLRKLNLQGNGLTGAIPPELGNLRALEEMWLSFNGLTGAIPSQLGNLANLKILNPQFNELTGPIPADLGNLASLEELNLLANALDGPIPPELGNLRRLRRLNLQINQLTGPIPQELGHVDSLERLTLGGNALHGRIPPGLGNLSRLEWLDLHTNALTGPVPPELGNLAGLKGLGLGWNSLTGPIPPELANLSRLEWLNLERSGLSGTVPSWLGDLSDLELLNLGTNPLMGSVPPELGSLARLERLYLFESVLAGPLPAAFLELPRILTFWWHDNTGEPPLCVPEAAAWTNWLAGFEWRGARCSSSGRGTGSDDSVGYPVRPSSLRLQVCSSAPAQGDLFQAVSCSPKGPITMAACLDDGSVLRADIRIERGTLSASAVHREEGGRTAGWDWLMVEQDKLRQMNAQSCPKNRDE